jgi:hypothetical protein
MPATDITIIAIGSNPLLAQEMADAIALILENGITIRPCLSKDLTSEIAGDLFICNKSQVNAVLKVIPVEKILILNLTPTTLFFVEVAKVPGGETIHVLNNRLEYALHLIDLCKEMNIRQVQFVPIAYEEMEEKQVTDLLANAKYIIGVDRLLGEGILFSERYKPFLHPDLVIIGAKRVAAIQSACALVKWFFLRMHNDISLKVTSLTNCINQTVQRQDVLNPDRPLSAMADEIKALASESAEVVESMQQSILQSIMTQFNAARAKNSSQEIAESSIQDIRQLISQMKNFD